MLRAISAHRPHRLTLLGLLLLATGCPLSECGIGPPIVDAGPTVTAPFAQSTRNTLAWKRASAVQQGFADALALAPDAVCKELGLYACTGQVHLVALGGNDPFNKSQYEPLNQPMPTTPIAMDRVALAACTARVNADAAGTPVVFTGFDLSADHVDASLDIFGTTADTLAKRLLARALRPDELAILKDLTTDDAGAPVPAHDVAVMMCFTLATLTENVLY